MDQHQKEEQFSKKNPPKKHDPVRRKKIRTILISIVVLLIVFRLFLPYIVLRYVNNKLSNLKEYYGHVDDIDIALIRGAYVINAIKVVKIGNDQGEKDTIPFFKSPEIDLSVEWNAIFKGAFVGEIYKCAGTTGSVGSFDCSMGFASESHTSAQDDNQGWLPSR